MKLSGMPIERGFSVRLMSPLGHYPTDSLYTDSASLIITPEICFSVVRVTRKHWNYSEVDSLDPIDIPLFGSLLLAGNAGDRHLYPYPTHRAVALETEGYEPMDESHIAQCRESLLTQLNNTRYQPSIPDTIHRPPIFGGAPYNLVAEQPCQAERMVMMRRLETASPLALRGVGALIKAQMAWQYREFGDAACIFLWISLDAAHSLTLQKLRSKGVPNPTSEDAARYFEEISGTGSEWEKFFEYDYENRIRVIHPDNRYRVEARPQLQADDFCELHEMLIPLFEFLITDKD